MAGSSCTCHVTAVCTNNGPNNGKVFSNCDRHLFKWHGSHNPPPAGPVAPAKVGAAMLQAAAKALGAGSCNKWNRGDVLNWLLQELDITEHEVSWSNVDWQ